MIRYTQLCAVGERAFPVADNRLWNSLLPCLSCKTHCLLELTQNFLFYGSFFPFSASVVLYGMYIGLAVLYLRPLMYSNVM